jgi:hypothetical protein
MRLNSMAVDTTSAWNGSSEWNATAASRNMALLHMLHTFVDRTASTWDLYLMALEGGNCIAEGIRADTVQDKQPNTNV